MNLIEKAHQYVEQTHIDFKFRVLMSLPVVGTVVTIWKATALFQEFSTLSYTPTASLPLDPKARAEIIAKDKVKATLLYMDFTYTFYDSFKGVPNVIIIITGLALLAFSYLYLGSFAVIIGGVSIYSNGEVIENLEEKFRNL